MLTEVKVSYQHSGISHMAHFSFIIRSRINRSGSKSGKHNFGRSRTRHQHSSRRRETAEGLTSFRAKHTTLFFCLALPSNNLFQIQTMCIGPYMQYSPLVPVVDLKNAAIVGSSWALVYSSAGTTKVTQIGIPVPRPYQKKHSVWTT